MRSIVLLLAMSLATTSVFSQTCKLSLGSSKETQKALGKFVCGDQLPEVIEDQSAEAVVSEFYKKSYEMIKIGFRMDSCTSDKRELEDQYYYSCEFSK